MKHNAWMLVATVGLGACDQGQPPVRQGNNLLEMGNQEGNPFNSGGPTQILLQYPFDQPFDAWSWRGSQLTNDANTAVPGLATTAQPFDLTQVALTPSTSIADAFVQYRSTHAFWTQDVQRGFQEYNQHEVVLFAREAEETFVTMTSLTQTPACVVPPCSPDEKLRDLFTPGNLPDVATLVYPPSPTWNTNVLGGPDPIHAFYDVPSFWRTGATPTNPAALPTGTGSVKNLMVVNHGLCSKFVPYADTPTTQGLFTPIFVQLGTAIEQQLAQGSATTPGSPSATLSFGGDIVSFIHTADERDASPQGGFELALDGHLANLANIVGFNINVDVGYANPYIWTIVDGRLSVDPLRQFSQGAGEGPVLFGNDLGPYTGAFVEEALDGVFLESLTVPISPTATPMTLAETVFQLADRTQVFPGVPPTTCTPGAFGSKIPVVADPTSASGLPSSLCGGSGGWFTMLHDDLQGAVSAGHFGSFIGVPPTAFDQLWNDTVLAPDESGSFYKNVRCAPNTTGVNSCQLLAPAHRTNVFPDGVELVFVDDDKEYTNPSFVAWLILADAADKTLLSKFCDPPQQGTQTGADPTQFVLGGRSYAHTVDTGNTFSATGCVRVSSNPDNYTCTIVVK